MRHKIEENSYKFTLESSYKNFAFNHLHESDNIRSQSLTQLKEWIEKDLSIKRCRTDAVFLLRFLRLKKFNVPAAYASIKKYLTGFQLYSKWTSNLSVDEAPLIQLISAGVMVPLPDRDEEGRQIILYRLGAIDPDIHTAKDIYRLQALVYHVLFEDEETQISGFSYLVDFAGFTMRHVTMFDLLEFKNSAMGVKDMAGVRICKADVLHMSWLLQPFYEISMMMLSPKLRRRIKFFNNVQDFKESHTTGISKIFPSEYGGEKDLKALSTEFIKKMETRRDLIASLNDMYIEVPKHMKSEWYQLDKNQTIDAGITGSFRKLELD